MRICHLAAFACRHCLQILLVSALLPCTPRVAAQNLTVVFPQDSARIASSDSIFVFGHFDVRPQNLTVNGQPASLFANQTFVAMIPVRAGALPIRVALVTASDTIEAERTVFIPPYFVENHRQGLEIDTSYFSTFRDLEIRRGERLTLFLKGTPGQRAFFTLPGLAGSKPMRELHARRRPKWRGSVFLSGQEPVLPSVRGLYAATFAFSADVPLGAHRLRFILRSANGDTISASPQVRIFVREASFAAPAMVRRASVEVDESGDAPEAFYFDEKAVVSVVGRSGKAYRVQLSADQSTWLPTRDLRFLPMEKIPAKARIRLVDFKSTAKNVRIYFAQTQRVPYRFLQESNPERLTVHFFGAEITQPDDQTVESNDRFVLLQSILQDSISARLTFQHAGRQQWGYRRFYEDSLFVIEIKRPPVLNNSPNLPLQNLAILLDAGHGPDLGAVGPTGLQEKEATANGAALLKKLLEQQGARVILTRDRWTGLNLAARALFAEMTDVDLFISLHFNALPASVNPLRSRGTSTYFFHPQSESLAQALQNRMLQATWLRNFGLFQRNLAVCRITAAPAVLLEPAFLMIPIEEQKISDPAFIERVCRGIVRGLVDFIDATLR